MTSGRPRGTPDGDERSAEAAARAREAFEDAVASRRRFRDAAVEGGTRGLRVLVVEDSHEIVDRIVEALASELPIDYVETVDSEPDALAARGPWDAAIVDLSLRDGNGFSVLRAFQRRAEPRPFVVVLTDHARAEFRSLAATFGARAFLSKATEFERLPDVLRPLVAARAPAPTQH